MEPIQGFKFDRDLADGLKINIESDAIDSVSGSLRGNKNV